MFYYLIFADTRILIHLSFPFDPFYWWSFLLNFLFDLLSFSCFQSFFLVNFSLIPCTNFLISVSCLHIISLNYYKFIFILFCFVKHSFQSPSWISPNSLSFAAINDGIDIFGHCNTVRFSCFLITTLRLTHLWLFCWLEFLSTVSFKSAHVLRHLAQAFYYSTNRRSHHQGWEGHNTSIIQIV